MSDGEIVRSLARLVRLLLMAGGLSMFCPQCSVGQTVTLLAQVEVAGQTIRLSDLLPGDAPKGMLRTGAEVELGQAPRLGSVRVLNPAEIELALENRPDLLPRLAWPERIAVRRIGYLIPAEAIREAIARRLPGGAVQSWKRVAAGPLEVRSLVPNPALRVEGTDWDERQKRMQVYLRCSRPSECGRFVVYVDQPQSRTARPEKEVRPASNSSLKRPGHPLDSIEQTPVLLHAGQKATLFLEDKQVRISLRVICLQGGRLGERIRVLDTAGRRVFRAEVIDQETLRSKLDS